MFTDEIRTKFRVVKTTYGGGDFEETIPLGSWRKGGGLAGRKGHVYAYSQGWAGIWLDGRSARLKAESLRPDFPDLKIMQVGDGELTFRVPFSDLDRILPLLGAKKRPVLTNARLAALKMATSKSIPHRFKKANGGERPVPDQG